MRIGHHHYVPRCIWIRVQADEAVTAAVDDASRSFRLLSAHAVLDRVVNGCNEVAEHAIVVSRPVLQRQGNTFPPGLVGRGDVAKTPGGEEKVHEFERSLLCQMLARGNDLKL